MVEELGEQEVLGLCVQTLNHIGAVVENAHSLFGAEVESTVVEVDMLRTQTLLETDVNSSLVAMWGWNDTA